MSQPINTHGSSYCIPRTSCSQVQPSQDRQRIAKRVALASAAALSLVWVVTTLALAITLAMPALAVATVIFSIIAVACCVLLNKKPQRDATPYPPLEEGMPENPRLTIPETRRAQPRSPESQSALVDTPAPAQPQDAPASSHLVPSAYELLSGWIPLPFSAAINIPVFDAVDITAPMKIWKALNTKTVLVSTAGDITKPRFTTRDLSPMLVNAANSTMFRGGSGTNYHFTQAVSKRGWENSKENKTTLQVGECSAGKWINADGTNNDLKPEGPAFLAQLLGPTAAQLNNDAKQCYQVVTQAYENCFAKALEKGAKYVQVPLISSSAFAPSKDLIVDGRSVRDQWIDGVKAALVTAAQHFAEANPDAEMVIVVTDINTLPL